ncbi:MAG TPA: DNA-binding domain-containing protein [Hyphomicrobium sp.]|nr:DNA-binding domain-containing protein [Hyphomicrobium sp.]
MAHKPPSLAEVQSRFQAALMDGSDDVLRLIPPNSRTTNTVLFGVYRHAYVARLIEVVRNAYPLLSLYMGDERSTAMARRYVALYPSRHANARWYATDVPELLAQNDFAAEPGLREISLIEKQLDLAFDAPDGAVLDLAALSAHAPETWGELSFVPHPSAATLPLQTNAFDIWLALKNEEATPAAKQLPEAQTFLVWRQDGVPRIRGLGEEERMLWTEASRGKSFGGLAEMAAVYDDPDTAAMRVAGYLAGWLGVGMISEAVTAAREAARV